MDVVIEKIMVGSSVFFIHIMFFQLFQPTFLGNVLFQQHGGVLYLKSSWKKECRKWLIAQNVYRDSSFYLTYIDYYVQKVRMISSLQFYLTKIEEIKNKFNNTMYVVTVSVEFGTPKKLVK